MSPPLDIFCPIILPLSLTYCLRVCHSKAHALPEKTELGLGEGVEVIGFASSQSAALFGHIGIGREHPDFFAAYLLNQIFGIVGLQSSLTRKFHKDCALTSGVGTYLAWRRHLLIGQFASSKD